MLLEAINSVFLTYLATEFLLIENHDDNPQTWHKITSFHQLRVVLSFFISHHSQTRQCIFLSVLSINLLVYFHATGVALAEWIHNRVERHYFHIPRILVVTGSFLLALYLDCRQKYKLLHSKHKTSSPPWSNRYFLQQLVHSFFRLLPMYPFLAVVVSFGFLFIITAFERLHLPLQLLNMPVYYGTLYG